MSQPIPPAPARLQTVERSSLRTYEDLAVGRPGWLALLRYELLAAWGALLPGAVGLGVRQLTWPALFGHSGRRCVWGRGVSLRHPGRMRIGEGVMVDDLCHLDARGCADGEFVLGDGVIIGRGSILNAKGGPLELGPRVNVGTNCMLFADGPLRIGADTMLAGGCYINGGGYAIDGPVDRPMREQAVQMSGVTIEEDCWLGAGVTVVAGVRIGRGSVIGAGALVNRDIPPYSVAVGVPARVVRRRQGAGLQRAEGAADAAPGAATGPGRAQRRKA